MAPTRAVDPTRRLLIIQQQQLAGAEAAMFGRPLRVPNGMWRRGGKRKTTTREITHYEAAYQQFSRGRSRALANEHLTAHEARSEWCQRGYYSTLAVMDLLGGRINELATDHAATTAPVEGADPPIPAPRVPKKTTPKKSFWGDPGHRFEFEDDFDDLRKVIEVAADGKKLTCSSIKQRRGEPIFWEDDSLEKPHTIWGRKYRATAEYNGYGAQVPADGVGK